MDHAEELQKLRAAMTRIHAAAESDADLQKLPGLRDFLLAESKPLHVDDDGS